MSEILTSDKLSTVAEEAIEIEEVAPAQEPEQVNYNEKSLSELVQLFEELTKKEDRLKLGKQADAIKSAFYKKLQAEKAAATDEVSEDLYSSLENGFKAVYETYRKERADWTAKLEKDKEANLEAKKAVIEDLKALLEKQEEINVTFPAFREIQNRWKAIGSVPQSGKSVYDEYQLYVEHFYDMVKINNELRELDFKKNLEVKTAFCEAAEKLAEEENVVAAFKELQKLHDQWKEYGPVAKEYRESIWDRFKAATAVVNKKYQEHFEVLKGQQVENLAKKEALCVKVEEIADKEISSLNEWTECSKQIEEIQKEWRTIGFATKKDNQKNYARFRSACDKFYNSKKEYYTDYKDGMNENLAKKIALCEAAEALKTSTDWKKTTDQLIAIQKQWREIGSVPRKKSEAVWKRFRAACDEFFAERDKNVKPENNFYGNLKAKKAIIEEIKAYELTGDSIEDQAALENFNRRYSEIGFVPYKEKDNVAKAFKAACSKFGSSRTRRAATKPISEKEKLIRKYNELEQNIVNYENNIGFFSNSKNSAPLIQQMLDKIEASKAELKALEAKIREME